MMPDTAGHAGPPDHVDDSGGGPVQVGKTREEQARDRMQSNDQLERVEAKLDAVLAILEGNDER
jgi:hypothetical protein